MDMNYTDPFVLHGDVLLIACADLSDDLRRRITFDEGDFTLSRRHGRALVQVIDGGTAALLELFREPCTIADAVFENSRSLGKDPEAWFDEVLPHLGTFVSNRVLVPAGSKEARETWPQFEIGDALAGYEIVRCASLVEDREIYELRGANGPAALKITRTSTAELRRLFKNEAAVLSHLDGSGLAPRLLDAGTHKGRPYLILEWIPGIDGNAAAAQRRHDRGAMIDLCASIIATYAALHARGLLHGDIHPLNVLVDGERVRLLDFGYARFKDRPPKMGRAAMPPFFEPEYLEARREGRRLPVSEAGEQYQVAALLYMLITGETYLDFGFDHDAMMRQIETERPLPFAEHGLPPWPEVERILFRALEKDPARRHASMSEMAALFFLEQTLQSYHGAPAAQATPSFCASVAVGLLRIAEIRDDPKLFALAAVWHSRAEALAGTEDADVHVAGAMIAMARGEMSRARELAHDAVRIARKGDLGVAALIASLPGFLPAAEDSARPGRPAPSASRRAPKPRRKRRPSAKR